MKVLILFGLVAFAAADSARHSYNGKYEGKCGKDGFYYKDESNFVICSNGNSYVQPCAPGSKNSGFDNYSYGGNYGYRDFCDVNLVDDGYSVKHKAAAPSYHAKDNYGYDDGFYGDYNYGRYGYGYGPRDFGYGRRDFGYGFGRPYFAGRY